MRSSYWFAAKRYGWGWGLPCAWQGWLVLIVWTAVSAVGLVLLRRESTALNGAFIGSMSLLLILVCWRTGEPPRWRWQSRQSPDKP